MARRLCILHIGRPLDGVADSHRQLGDHAALLAAAGLAPAPATARDLDRAATELLHEHRERGLRRRDVEGTWAEVCRRIHRGRGHVVLSEPRLAGADDEQVALLLDGLAGLAVHVLVTRLGGDEPEAKPAAVRQRWGRLLRPHRVHVRDLEEGATAIDLAEELTGLGLCLQHERAARRSVRLRLARSLDLGRRSSAPAPLAS